VSNRVSRRQAGRWSQQADAEAYEQQQQQPEEEQQQQPAGDDMSAKIEQLRQLGELKTQGVLTQAEFDQQKARILGS
jgi:hypothetical protein